MIYTIVKYIWEDECAHQPPNLLVHAISTTHLIQFPDCGYHGSSVVSLPTNAMAHMHVFETLKEFFQFTLMRDILVDSKVTLEII
jgi:hypothetical protein